MKINNLQRKISKTKSITRGEKKIVERKRHLKIFEERGEQKGRKEKEGKQICNNYVWKLYPEPHFTTSVSNDGKTF